MKNFSNIYILFFLVTFCLFHYDVLLVHFYLHSEFLLSVVLTSMLVKCKGHAKACDKKVNAKHA